MTSLGQLAPPIGRASTGLPRDQTPRLRRQTDKHLRPPELFPKHNGPVRARAMELDTRFRQIDADDVNLFHGHPACRAVDYVTLTQCEVSGTARPPHRLPTTDCWVTFLQSPVHNNLLTVMFRCTTTIRCGLRASIDQLQL